MSSIYGYYQDKGLTGGLSDPDMENMARWNKNYGAKGDKKSFGNVFIGAYIDRLNDELPDDEAVFDHGNLVSVIDAVIFNRDEVLSKLEIIGNKTISDEELILSLIERYGYQALENVNGDFAGAVYDRERDTITLFRDHMGVRPLFYYCLKDFVLFSTDIRGIIAVKAVDAGLNEDWIYKTAAGAFAIDMVSTEYRNIFCVKPGSILKFSFADGMVKKQENVYWMVGKKKIRLSSDEEYQKRLRELIEDAIRRRLNAVSGMVGAELSGGLDSGVIDILINRMGRKCLYFSWSDSPENLEMAENDERYIIEDICKQEKIECNYGLSDLGENSAIYKKTEENGISVSGDDPIALRFAFPPYVNTIPIYTTAEYLGSHGAKVVFTGHGGDEGVSHRANSYEMFYNHEYYHYFRYMFSTTHGQKNRIIKTLRKCKKNIFVSGRKFKGAFSSDLAFETVLNNSFAERYKNKTMPTVYFAFDPISYVRQGGSRNRLDNVAFYSSYCNIRYLVPFLDYRVVDFAVSIPRYQYLRGRKNRYIFREAFKDIMPASLYRLRDKETKSLKSIKPNPDWFIHFDDERRKAVGTLNREVWSKYLDFDEIDRWLESGEPVGDEKDKAFLMNYVLGQFAAAQNLVDKVRAV